MVDSVDEDGVDEFCFGLSRGVRVWCEDGLKSVGETVVSISMTDGLDWVVDAGMVGAQCCFGSSFGLEWPR